MGGGSGGGIPSRDLAQLEEQAKATLKSAKEKLKSADDNRCHVFISFAYEDENDVNLLRGQKENENTDLEFDDFSLKEEIKSKNSEYIKKRIRERIKRSAVTIVYLSQNSAKSEWVEWEIAESIRQNKSVIGVYKGDTPPDEIPEAFSEYGLKVVKWSHEEIMNAIAEARANKEK